MNDILNDPEFLEWEQQLVGNPVHRDHSERKSRWYSERYNEHLEWFKFTPGITSPPMTNTVQPMFDLKHDTIPPHGHIVPTEAMIQRFDPLLEQGDAIL